MNEQDNRNNFLLCHFLNQIQSDFRYEFDTLTEFLYVVDLREFKPSSDPLEGVYCPSPIPPAIPAFTESYDSVHLFVKAFTDIDKHGEYLGYYWDACYDLSGGCEPCILIYTPSELCQALVNGLLLEERFKDGEPL